MLIEKGNINWELKCESRMKVLDRKDGKSAEKGKIHRAENTQHWNGSPADRRGIKRKLNF